MARRARPFSGPLDLRSQAILRAVIEEYVTTATPVGSQALVERYRLGVSSATVRAVLAELEAAGLLTHPHTSAGPRPHRERLPLLRRVDRRQRAAAAGRAADDPPPVRPGGVRERALVPARGDHPRLVTRAAGLATPAKPTSAHLRRLDLVSISDRMASLILVLREGSLKQVLISLDEPTTQDDLSRVAGLLNELLEGRTAVEAERALAHLPAGDATDLHAAGRRARRPRPPGVRRGGDRGAVLDGLLNVMAAPEFAQSEKLRRVFAALENRAYLAHLISGRRRLGHRPRLHRLREPGRGDGRRVAGPRPLRPTRAAASAWSASSGPRAWRIPRRSARSASSRGLMNELIDHLYA